MENVGVAKVPGSFARHAVPKIPGRGRTRQAWRELLVVAINVPSFRSKSQMVTKTKKKKKKQM